MLLFQISTGHIFHNQGRHHFFGESLKLHKVPLLEGQRER